jgi:hypothetical protein
VVPLTSVRDFAALMLILATVTTRVWADEAAPASPVQIAFQLGTVLEAASQETGPAGTMDLIWFPWSFGGIWSEIGVLEPKGEESHLLLAEPLASGGTATLAVPYPVGVPLTEQHLEGSIGFIWGGTTKNAGYLRGGIGAYRIEKGIVSAKGLSNAAAVPGYANVSWTMGANLAGGARFAQPTWHAQPMFELRVHVLPRGDYDEHANVLLSASGGLWFR